MSFAGHALRLPVREERPSRGRHPVCWRPAGALAAPGAVIESLCPSRTVWIASGKALAVSGVPGASATLPKAVRLGELVERFPAGARVDHKMLYIKLTILIVLCA